MALTIGDLVIDPGLLGLSRGERCRLEECKGGCCRNGVWVDAAHRDLVLSRAAEVRPHLPPERQDPGSWFDDEEMVHSDFASGRGVPTAVFPDPFDSTLDTCVFRRPDGLCALQRAAPELKPFDCYTYPILRSEGEVTLDRWSPDELEGADCQRACTPPRPLLEVFAEELVLALGRDGYTRLCAAAGYSPPPSSSSSEG